LPTATLNGMFKQRAISFRISCLNSAQVEPPEEGRRGFNCR